MFSKNLKFLRENSNMEQIELAEKLGRKSASSISEWEKGKYTPNFGTLRKIANIFNVTVEDLMEKDLSDKTSSNDISEKMDVIAAHIDENVTDEEMEEIVNFIEFMKSKRD